VSKNNLFLQNDRRVVICMDNKKKNTVIEVIDPLLKIRIENEVEGLKFTKNFRSATAEEWYVLYN
jgi:hypothetical protein